MILTQTAEYALRAMSHLAALPRGEMARSREVSAATGIPLSYAAKILRRLVAAGLLEAQKGHGGGFRLRRAASKISFLEVIEAVEDPLDPKRCVFGGSCRASRPCLLHGPMSELKDSTLRWARETTFAGVATASEASIRRARRAQRT